MNIPAAGLFQGIMAWLTQSGIANREQRVQERIAIKKGKGHADGSCYSLRWYEKRKRLRKLQRLARRKNRDY